MSAALDVKVYTVNGPASGSSSSLPDWLTRKRTSKKRSRRERVETTLQLIQDFEFPEASIRIRTTKDGHHAIATGVYKPQMRVWDLDQLTLKFERHTDAENVDFIILSEDWTKTLHLQADRNLEFHTQGGFHYRTRIPRMGRALAYHFPSCDAYVGATGSEVYRLNLNEGRFMTPITIQGDGEGFEGVNVVDINPAHQLVAFGLDGSPHVEFWDPRSRSRVGLLRLPTEILQQSSAAAILPGVERSSASRAQSVTALASRSDGLSFAVGTSTGHSLLYDLRSSKAYATKDQGYGLPIKGLSWIEGMSKGRLGSEGLVLSADRKVVKIWDRNEATTNFASITPTNDINSIHHIPSTGLIMLAHEGIELSSVYVPQLGPAPKWCSFLDNITEEMEEQTVRNVYEDYKFVERNELVRLGLDHLIGTPALRPYMHGYFLQLKLYDAARMISNPFAFEEHREKLLKEKMEKLADSRIRSRKGESVKVNKALAERIQRAEEKEEKRKARKAAAKGEGEHETPHEMKRANLMNDSRFKAIFEDPEYQIDEESREFSLLNPSTVAQKHTVSQRGDNSSEEIEADSLSDNNDSENDDDSNISSDENSSSDDGELISQLSSRQKQYDPLRNRRGFTSQPRLVPVEVDRHGRGGGTAAQGSKRQDMSFGQRRGAGGTSKATINAAGEMKGGADDMGGEISWIPATTGESDAGDNDTKARKKRKAKKGSGFGLEHGEDIEKDERHANMGDNERKGRTQRRTGVRSGSKNAFRRM